LLQSNVIGWATVAPLAGLIRLGAAGVPGFTVSVTVLDVPPNAPAIVTGVEVVTVLVVTVKLALLDPEATVTLAGTVVALELSESDTTAPPFGAGALNVTVPVEELPPATLVGLTVTAERAGAGAASFTVIAENWNTPSMAAESCGVVRKPGKVVTSKLALVAPGGMKTLAGTLAERG